MTKPWLRDDLVEYLEQVARKLAPAGVRRVRVAENGLEMEFWPVLPPEVSVAPTEADGEGGEPSLEEIMNRPPPADPLDDPATFGGRRVPGYARRPSRPEE